MNNKDKMMAFHSHLSSFIAIILNLIKDINFKICLTAINITRKLLSLDSNLFNQN